METEYQAGHRQQQRPVGGGVERTGADVAVHHSDRSQGERQQLGACGVELELAFIRAIGGWRVKRADAP